MMKGLVPAGRCAAVIVSALALMTNADHPATTAAGAAPAGAASDAVVASAPFLPTLLGLEPDSGPLDGGTRVRLHLLSDSVPLAFSLLLRIVGLHGDLNATSQILSAERASDGTFSFITPDLIPEAGSVLGLFVSVTSRDKFGAVGVPLFFRVSGPLASGAPAHVQPCCEFALSGGDDLKLFGEGVPAAARHPLLRFRSATHEQDVVAHLVPGGSVPLAADGTPLLQSSRSSWEIIAAVPTWPKAEGHVMIEVSWNGQQFVQYDTPVRFMEEASVFGDVATVDETHLSHNAQKAAGSGVSNDGAVEELVRVIDDTGNHASLQEHGGDLSHVLLVDHDGDTFVMSRNRDLSYMQEDLRLIRDLFLLIFVSMVGGWVVKSLRLPSVIGFVLGGVVVGPGGFDAITELVQVESTAELGVCLMLFCLALEVSFAELLANTRPALAAVLAMAGCCCCILLLAGVCTETPALEALYVGLFASLSSTTVSLQAAGRDDSLGAVQKKEKDVLRSVLVTQDIALAGLLAALPRFTSFMLGDEAGEDVGLQAKPVQSGSAGNVGIMGVTEEASSSFANPRILLMLVAVNLVACAVFLYVSSFRRDSFIKRVPATILPYLRGWLLRLDDEFFALLTLSFAFGLSSITHRLGLSLELGSFLAGMLISSLSHDVAMRTLGRLGGFKDVFAALFFSSVGLVVSWRFLLDNIFAILSVVVFVFILKIFTSFFPLRLLATRTLPSPGLTALRLSCILAHVGEFGFVLAARAARLTAISRHVYLLLVGANAVSLCIAPWLFNAMEVFFPRDEDLLPRITSVGVGGNSPPPSPRSATRELSKRHPRSDDRVSQVVSGDRRVATPGAHRHRPPFSVIELARPLTE